MGCKIDAFSHAPKFHVKIRLIKKDEKYGILNFDIITDMNGVEIIIIQSILIMCLPTYIYEMYILVFVSQTRYSSTEKMP